jgi:hypothetical protein
MTTHIHHRPFQRKRKGNIVVLSSIMLVVLLGMVAFAIDLAYLMLAREELQRSADSAALAAAWELVDEDALSGDVSSTLVTNALGSAEDFASFNSVLGQSPGLAGQDVEIGYLANFTDPNEQLDVSGVNAPNAARVVVRRVESQNGRIPFFFAGVLGVDDASAQAEATAALLKNFGGFRTPPSGGNIDLLPFALDLDTWNDLLDGIGSDDWKWDADLNQVVAGSDGILEVNLYPQGTGSPGNRGTVDIGSSNNSTADIARQIVYGVSPADLAHHGGSLQFDENGELELNGDTGISAGVKDELASIIGQRRVIPIFSQVTGPGNNAQYTIVKFAGVRILEVKLTGQQSKKRVMIQPANIVVEGGIPASGTPSSYFVHSPAWIIR